MNRRGFVASSLAVWIASHSPRAFGEIPSNQRGVPEAYRFDRIISRDVLDHYLGRAITIEGMLHGRSDLDDDIRMLTYTGAKYIGRSICLWGGESDLLQKMALARKQLPRVHAADPQMILEACIFEIVTTEVEQVPVPEWALTALGMPVVTRSFSYEKMIYLSDTGRDQWGNGASVPDVSRPETQLWFYFLAASYIDLGIEGIHFGQVEIMDKNDPDLSHWAHVFDLVRAYASTHARRHMVLCNAHVPSGGLVRDGHLLLDFHAFPLRVKEVPDKPEHGILEVGYTDAIYGRSKGGITYSGWSCEHLPYVVELDNWGVSKEPGKAGQRGFWVWGYDEISWFANQAPEYRAEWLQYAWNWVRTHDPNGYLEMPGSRTERSPLNHRSWYYANRPSPAVPEGMGDETAIRRIWQHAGF